jgi:two-component system NtrC family sensor kinase
MLNLSGLKPRFWDHRDAAAGTGSAQFSFRRKWLLIVVFTTLVTLTPLLVMAIVDYRLTRQAFESEAIMGISRNVSNTWRSITYLLSQRRAALEFLARDNTLADLLTTGRLETLLSNLKDSMDDFIDLGVVDKTCTVKGYAGPDALHERRVMPAICFDRVVTDGYFISDVMEKQDTGHLPRDGFYVLRATLDADLLTGPVSQLVLDESDDAFIVSTQGVLQTPSRHYGRRFSVSSLTIPQADGGIRVQRTFDPSGRPLLMGIAPIGGSSFRLVMVRQESGIRDLWFKPRIRLIGFLAFSIILIMVSILGVATYLINRIHAADQRRVQALHQVEYANKLASIGRLASGVAHEINNPLAIINQKAGLIKDLFTLNRDWAGNAKLMNLVEDVLDSVNRCGAITRRLLDFSRHMESSVEAVEIEATIRQVIAFMEKEAQRRHIAVSVSVKGMIPIIETDRGNLQQIFLNVINNAFAAMTDGGRLEIVIAREGTSQIRVKLSDTGHGIPEADLKRVFEPFFTTRQGRHGTGLGLSVTYGMVSEMGGTITVTSQIDRGTTVTITLPLSPPGTSSATAISGDLSGQPVASDPSTKRKPA